MTLQKQIAQINCLKILFILFIVLTSQLELVLAQTRKDILLDHGWKFTREDGKDFAQKNFDDASWQSIQVPHDWAIYGPFSANNDKQHMAIAQDGQKEALEHAGRTGGLPFVGVGWYRNAINVGNDIKNKTSILQFDGAMSNAKVYVNGQKVGIWPNGYNSFYFDVSDFLVPGENTIAVRLENQPESSRWYPGAGLYRNVHLSISNKNKIAHWGTYVTTPTITPEYAKVNVETSLEIDKNSKSQFSLVQTIYNKAGQEVAQIKEVVGPYDINKKNQSINLPQPKLWSTETPNLYTLKSDLYGDGKLVDSYKTTFGVRSLEIIPDKGFFLNGQKTVFKGVCIHHDLGPLGAAVNEAALRRQVRIMKDMGVNAIRTSHNMPAPELVKICDEMGMMLMAESFDEWKVPKMKNGYNLYFDQWAEKDLVNLIHHYRNNPSIIMWCIGNEVPEQYTAGGSKVARFLQDICHREDPSRPVTQGMDNPDAVLNSSFASTMDVAGFNYRPFKYPEAYKKLQQQIILGTETASTLSSRGVYKFPVTRKSMARYPDHQASSYDVEHCSWSDLPEDNFIQHEDLPYAIGEFVWTGFDYLGEPTPYYTDWPSHSSLFGIVDLAGIPKDRYYLYRSHWNKAENTLHILPHWTWPGRERDTTPIFVYTNYPAAELFINGKSQGIQRKDTTINVHNSGNKESLGNLERQKRYRLMWMNTVYEPGTIKVVAYDDAGNIAAEKSIQTADKATRLELEADRNTLQADGKDISFVTVSLIDKNGNFSPAEVHELQFRVSGQGSFKAVANGNPASLESFQEPKMKTFSGKLVVLIQSTDKPGDITLEVKGKGLKTQKIKLKSK